MTNTQKPKGKWTPEVIQHMLDRVPSLPWSLDHNGNIHPRENSWLPMVASVNSVPEAELIICMPDMITQLLQERQEMQARITELEKREKLLNQEAQVLSGAVLYYSERHEGWQVAEKALAQAAQINLQMAHVEAGDPT
jgi:hypothetical protein